MFQWLFRDTKPVLVGQGAWIVTYDSGETRYKGYWMAFENKKGKRTFSTTNCPYSYDVDWLPGFGEMRVWQEGGPLPTWMKEVKQ